MSLLTEKILNFVKLNDENDYDEDYDEDEDEFDAPKRNNRVKSSPKSSFDEDSEQTESFGKSTNKKTNKTKVMPMKNKNDMEVCVIKPSTIEDGCEIADTLVSGIAVILNLEGIHVELAQRIIDFTSGACYAIRGNMQKVSNYIFIASPPSVEISGDVQEIIDKNSTNFSEF
ncbi:MAG: cell division protein SepF [Lachnospiraceae bacterium]|nr:cell division protein SepF [Lachnospiraceae bacterium]